MISFNQIPNNIRVPGAYVEIDNTEANLGLANIDYRHLVFGQMLPSGTATADVPVLVTNPQQAVILFGRGSVLANMFDALFRSDPFIEKWAVPLQDDVAAVEATGTITVAGLATESRALSLYVGGERLQVVVSEDDSETDVAESIVDSINGNLDLPVTASNVAGVVTLVARNAGELGNQIDLRINYLSELGGEQTPAGITVVIVPMSGGSSNPDLTNALGNLPDEIYSYWASPYFDAANLTLVENELATRWGPTAQLEGHCISAAPGGIAALSTLGNSRNSESLSILDSGFNNPTPAYIWLADTSGQVARSVTNDPVRPFQTLPLRSVKASLPEDRRTLTEKNTLLYDGISTHQVTKTGQVQLERLITTYRTNPAGVDDASYLDANIRYILSLLRQTFRARVLQKFPRHALADDGTRFAGGRAVVTPKIIRAEIIALAGQWEERGLIEDMEAFKSSLVVERNPDDPNRVDVIIRPNLTNQFIILAAAIRFRN